MCSRNQSPDVLNCLQNGRCPYTNRGRRRHKRLRTFLLIFPSRIPGIIFRKNSDSPTEWISKAKAGVPVELGLRVCVVEDAHSFILHHQVMEKTTDDQIALYIVKQTQSRFPTLKTMSMDKGFHSPKNQTQLKEMLGGCPRIGAVVSMANRIELF